MSGVRIRASSHVVGEVDQLKRELAWEVLRLSNEPVVSFAKLMVPTALTTIGVITALAKDRPASRALVVSACVLALFSALLFAHAAYARRVRISLDDYDDVLDELLAVATLRQRETTAALALLSVAVLIAVSALVT